MTYSLTRRLPGLLLIAALAALVLAPRAARAQDGFEPIFDGETLQGWDGDAEFWRVEDGAITGETSEQTSNKGNTFIIWTKGETADFELKLEYRILSRWANSGIQYRSERLRKYLVRGYQADLESGLLYSGSNYGENTGRGILAGRGKKAWLGDGATKNKIEQFADSRELQTEIRSKGEWNDYHIIARGNHMIHKINGVIMSETVDESKRDARFKGVLALQLHSGPPMKVQFRNIRIKHLKRDERPRAGGN
jgi:hypothetical protein